MTVEAGARGRRRGFETAGDDREFRRASVSLVRARRPCPGGGERDIRGFGPAARNQERGVLGRRFRGPTGDRRGGGGNGEPRAGPVKRQADSRPRPIPFRPESSVVEAVAGRTPRTPDSGGEPPHSLRGLPALRRAGRLPALGFRFRSVGSSPAASLAQRIAGGGQSADVELRRNRPPVEGLDPGEQPFTTHHAGDDGNRAG